jgi:hypothetical protein
MVRSTTLEWSVSAWGSKPDPSDTEELHVLVTADNDEDADKVCLLHLLKVFAAKHYCCYTQ